MVRKGADSSNGAGWAVGPDIVAAIIPAAATLSRSEGNSGVTMTSAIQMLVQMGKSHLVLARRSARGSLVSQSARAQPMSRPSAWNSGRMYQARDEL